MKSTQLREATVQTISIHADYDKAFEYITNPLNQKEWAVNFIKDVVFEDGKYIATTSFGKAGLECHCDKKNGVIDWIMGGGEPIKTRLIKNLKGCEYSFVLFQPDGMPDIVWEKEGIPGLIEELETLKSILENEV